MLTCIAVLAVFLVFVLSGCTTTKVVTEYRDSIQYVAHYDTLIVHQLDSVDRYRSNDTVYLTRWREVNTLEIKHDTINVTKTEQIPYEVEVIKTKTPSWCWWLLAVVVAFGLYRMGRIALKIYTQGRV